MITKQDLKYSIEEMLMTRFLIDNHSMNHVECDPETGDFIIDGKHYEEHSRDNDETLAIYEDQFNDKIDSFLNCLDKYISQHLKS
jgi:hypothetical protein